MVNLTIDGKALSAREGQTILEVARENRIFIPTLCHHTRLTLIKSCRICLVDVEGAGMPVAACATPVAEGMTVATETERVCRMREEALRLLLVNHPLDCPVCDAGGECQLQDLTYGFGIRKNDFPPEPREIPKESYGTPLIRQWTDRCVMCLRCIQACIDIPGADVLEVADRGFPAHIRAARKEACISCGECLAVCPVGALTESLSPLKGRTWQAERVQTTCPFCGCGCQLELNVIEKKRIARVTTKTKALPNEGSLCVKGRFGYDFVHAPDRLKKPLIRRNGALVETGWDEALSFVADRLKEIAGKHGPGSIAGIGSARATNEENFLFQKWLRACVGTNHVDSGASLSAGAVGAAMRPALGFGGMTHAMEDVARADLLLVVGADPYDDHLIFSNRMREALRFNNAKVVVVDPRKTKWETWADLWLRPTPGSDLAWIGGLCRLVVEKGAVSKEFVASATEGFESLRASLDAFTDEVVASASGIGPEELNRLASLYLKARRRAIVFGSGVFQHSHGAETVRALTSLALLTGETEQEGGGLYPLLPQNNCQGAFDMGLAGSFLPGYVPVGDAGGRARFEEAWDRTLPAEAGYDCGEFFEKIHEGKIKGLYLFGEDPLITLPNLERLRNGLRQLDLLVVQDAFLTHAAEFAHVVLPGTTFAEKDGTFTNMERRIQRVRQALLPPGEARPDGKIFCDLGSRMGYIMTFDSAEKVTEEIISLVPAYAVLRETGPDGTGSRWEPPRSGKRSFAPMRLQTAPETPDEAFPLWVIPRGFHFHYGIGTTTRRAAGLAKVFPETCLEVHPADAGKAGAADGDRIVLASPRGQVETVLRVSAGQPEGVATLAVTFFPVFVNGLLAAATGVEDGGPEYKAFAGRIQKTISRKA